VNLQQKIDNIPEQTANRTNAVCEGIHDNAIWHTHLQYLKYFFIAGLPKAIMQLVDSKDPVKSSAQRSFLTSLRTQQHSY